MNKKPKMESILAYSTVALAVGTFIMAFFTYRLVSESKDASTRQIGVQTWLEMQKRFDSKEMKSARRALAAQLLKYDGTKHDTVSETVLNFFEDVGALHKKGFIDKELTDSSFSFYASRWWEGCKAYVDEEQKRHKADDTLFEDFKYLANQLRAPNEKIDDLELKRFLEDESRLVIE